MGMGLDYWGAGLPFGDDEATPLKGDPAHPGGHVPSTSTLAHSPHPLFSPTVPPPHSQAQAGCPRSACPLASQVASSPLGSQRVFSK